jgi:acyl carrier protein
MDIQSFIAGFSDQFEDGASKSINSNTEFKKLDSWDSLTTMLVIGYISSEYNKNLGKSDLDICTTVQDLFDYISSK